MPEVSLDAQERDELCDLFDRFGPSVPTLLEGWTAHDLAAHLVLREHDSLAGPCLVLPGPFEKFAEYRRARLVHRRDFESLVERIRSGPPIGFFRIDWVRSFPTLNEFFVHHEDLRRANLTEVRTLSAEMETALWNNARRGGRYLSRRVSGFGLELEWGGTDQRAMVRQGKSVARLGGPPGELLLYLFGRGAAAQIDVTGPPEAVAAIHRTHFGM